MGAPEGALLLRPVDGRDDKADAGAPGADGGGDRGGAEGDAERLRHARQRYGRFSTGTDGLCIVCDARPVFDTSAQAKKWRLCKGCYLAERKRRLEEEAESNRIRQAAHRRQKLDGDV